MNAVARALFVCTANQCRSPLAESIARAAAEGLPIEFASAGLIAGGYPMPPTGVRVAAELGMDLSEHLSRQVDFSTLDGFDVVLTMTREHSRELVVAQPDLWPRVFTVKQFSRWLTTHPGPASAELGEWLAQEARDRPRSELIGSSASDDVADPLTAPARVWREVARELGDHIREIIASLYPDGAGA